jgi:hypothetical protein
MITQGLASVTDIVLALEQKDCGLNLCKGAFYVVLYSTCLSNIFMSFVKLHEIKTGPSTRERMH